VKYLKIRIISSVIGIPILIALVIFGGLPLQLAVSLFSLVGIYEFYKAINKDIKKINSIGYLFTLIFVNSILYLKINTVLIFISLFILVLLIAMIAEHPKYSIIDVCITFSGFFYVTFLLSHVLLVRQQPNGYIYIWLIFITAWGSDTGAYFMGKAFGKRKLAPVLSPNKTIAGSLGGILFSAVLCMLYGIFMNSLFSAGIHLIILKFAIIGIIGSVMGQIGDLAASSIKRYTGIKDYGNLIPGHGGVLDRFDSVLFTAPLVYYLVMILG
jgi:phosphatidate cytidylyltransferase